MLIKRTQMPIIKRLIHKQELEIKERKHKQREEFLKARQEFNTGSLYPSQSRQYSKKFNRKSSKIVQLGDLYHKYKENIEHQEYSDYFSDAEDEDIKLSFEDYIQILKKSSHKFNAFECIPLEYIEDNYNNSENDDKPNLRDYFVYADYIQPGKHKFVLFEHNEFHSYQNFDLIVPYRDSK